MAMVMAPALDEDLGLEERALKISRLRNSSHSIPLKLSP